jgi:hypothetical protein
MPNPAQARLVHFPELFLEFRDSADKPEWSRTDQLSVSSRAKMTGTGDALL